jgi:hypothetical protein
VGEGGLGSGTMFKNWMLVIIGIFSGYTVSLCQQRSLCQLERIRAYAYTCRRDVENSWAYKLFCYNAHMLDKF